MVDDGKESEQKDAKSKAEVGALVGEVDGSLQEVRVAVVLR